MSDGYELECIGKFGEYEVWQSTREPDWHITDAAGEFIFPGDDDLLKALTLIADRRKAVEGGSNP